MFLNGHTDLNYDVRASWLSVMDKEPTNTCLLVTGTGCADTRLTQYKIFCKLR